MHGRRGTETGVGMAALCRVSRVVASSSFLLGLCGSALLAAQTPASPIPAAKAHAARKPATQTLPLVFEKNQGQFPEDLAFVGRTERYAVAIGSQDVQFSLPGKHNSSRIVLSLRGSDVAKPEGLAEAPFRTNYYIGSKPSDYRLGVRNYNRVGLSAVYPGIDVQFYATGNTIEHDFLVAPGADASQIAMSIAADGRAATLNAAGDLVVKGDEGELRLEKPVAYQLDANGKRHTVSAAFVLASNDGERELSFRLGDYDHSRQLVIDPVIQYASFFDAAAGSTAASLVSDTSGNIYLAGSTNSAASGFGVPVTLTNEPPAIGLGLATKTGPAAFLARFSSVASTPVVAWLDYYSGTTDTLATTAALQPGTTLGTVAIGGYTTATDLPGTPLNAVTGVSQRGFVATFSEATGLLGQAAYIDSNMTGQTSATTTVNALAIDSSSTPNIYAVGTANGPGLPATTNALPVDSAVVSGTANKGFVYELTPGLLTLGDGAYISYVNGNTAANTSLTGVAVDGSGDIFVGGSTLGNFPQAGTYSDAAMNVHNPTDTTGNDSFVAEIVPTSTASTLLYSTWLSGLLDDELTSIALDSTGNLYAFGQTASSDLFTGPSPAPATSATYTPTYSYTYAGGTTPITTPTPGQAGNPVTKTFPAKTAAGSPSGFVVKLDPTGQPQVGTFLGADGNDAIAAGIVSTTGMVYAAGSSSSVAGMGYGTAVTLSPSEDLTSGSSQRGFLVQLQNDLSKVNIVANFGGVAGPDFGVAVALDNSNHVFFGGNVNSTSAFTTSGAFKTARTATTGSSAYFAQINPAGAGDPGFTLMANTCAADSSQPNQPVGCPDPIDFSNKPSTTYTFTLTPDSTSIPATGLPTNVTTTFTAPATASMSFSNCTVTDNTNGTTVTGATCATATGSTSVTVTPYPSTLNTDLSLTLHTLTVTVLGTLLSEPTVATIAIQASVASTPAVGSANTTLTASENSNIAPVLAITGTLVSPAAGSQVFTTNISPTTAPASTQLSYSFTITNTGGGSAAGATFTLPSTSASGGFVIGTVSATGTGTASGMSTCTLAANGCSSLTLNNGDTVVVTVTGVYLDSTLGSSATVSAPNFPVSASATSGSGTDAITTSPAYSLTPGITLARGVHLTLSNGTFTGQRTDGNYYLGDTITYTVTVTNAGPSISHGTETVKFTLPTGFTPSSSNCTASPCSPTVSSIGASGTTTVTITGSFLDSSTNAGIGAGTTVTFSPAVALDTTYDVDSNPGVGTLTLSNTAKIERSAPLTISSPLIVLPATACAGGGSCLYMQNSGVKDSATYTFTLNNGGPNVSVNTVFTITLPSAPVNPAGTYHALVSTAPTSSISGAAPFGTAISCVRNNTASNTAPASNTLTCTGNLPSGTLTVMGSLSADGNTVPLTVASVNTSAATLGSMAATQNATINSLPGAQGLTPIEIDRVAHLVTTTASAATGTTPTTPIDLDETATATTGVDDTVTVTINVGNTALNSTSGALTASLPQYFRITALPTVVSTTAGTTVAACTLPAGYALNSTTTATPPSFTCPITVIAPGTATPSSGATAATNPAPQIKVTYSGKFLDNGTGVDITNVPSGSATKVASLTAALGTATATVQFAIDPYPGTTDSSSAPSIAVQRLVHMYLAKTRNTSVAAAPAGFADTTDPNLDEKKTAFGANDEIEYDVAVANGGANKALGVQFSDTLPPYFTLVNTYLIQPGKTTNPDTGPNQPPTGLLTGALACYLGSTTSGTPLTTPFSTGAAGQVITCTYGTTAAPLALNTGAASVGTFHNAASIELVYQGKFQDNAPGVDNIPAGASTYSVTFNANDAFVTATLDVDNGTAADRSSTALAAYKIQRAAHLLLVTPTAPLTDLSGNTLTKAADGTSIAAQGEPSTIAGSNPVVNCVRYKMYIQNVGPNVARSPMLSATLPGGMKLVGTPVATTTTPNSDAPQGDTCSYGGGASSSVIGSALVPTSESAGNSLVVDLDGYFDVNTLTNVNSLSNVALTYSALSDGTTAAPSSMDSGGTAFTATKGTVLTVVNTPYGSNFSLAPFSTTATQPVALTFGSVGTPGITSLAIAATTTASLPKGQSPLPNASSTAINLYQAGTSPQYYSLASTAATITGNTGVCVANAMNGQALSDTFAKPERVLLWDLVAVPSGTRTGTVPNVTSTPSGDITSSVLAFGNVSYVQPGGPLSPYDSTHKTLPAKQPQPLRVCGNLNGFAPATLAVLEPVNFTPVITANPSSPTQTPGKGVSEVTFLFPTAFDFNNNDPCYVATTSGGAATRNTCDDNKVLTTRIYGGTSLVPSQPYEIGPMTPDATTSFVATTFEVQAGQNLYDFVTDQLAEVKYLATNSCDPTGNPSSNPCPTTAAALTTNLQQITLFGSGDIALLTPSVNGGSSALIIIPQGQNPSSNSTGVLGGAAQATATVNAGQTVGFLWRLRLDTGTTTGTYNLTCNMVDAATQTTVMAFPTGLTCQVPASVTLPTDVPVYIVTQGGSLYGSNSFGWKALGGTVFAGMLLPFLLFRRRLSYPRQIVLMALLMLLGAAGLSGCGSGNNSTSGISTTSLPAGTYWFRLSATPTAGGAATYSTAFSVKVVSGS